MFRPEHERELIAMLNDPMTGQQAIAERAYALGREAAKTELGEGLERLTNPIVLAPLELPPLDTAALDLALAQGSSVMTEQGTRNPDGTLTPHAGIDVAGGVMLQVPTGEVSLAELMAGAQAAVTAEVAATPVEQPAA